MLRKGSVLGVGPLVFIALAWVFHARHEVSPEIYAVHQNDALAQPCSFRREFQTFKLDLSGGNNGSDVLSRFGVENGWGVTDNVSVVQNPAGNGAALEVRYAAGVSSPSTQDPPVAGAVFYAPGGFDGSQDSACLRYSVYFPSDFDFVRGGKLPGLFGGDRPPSGGARPKGDDGFTLRLMWRKGGLGELYGYFPNMEPDSEQGGDQIGTGLWTFERGAWTDIEIEAQLNDAGASNGTTRIWINEAPVLTVRNIRFRETEGLGIGGLAFSTFFGGQSAQFAPSKDQRIYFKDFELFR